MLIVILCVEQVVAGNRAGMDTILLDTTGVYVDRSSLQGEMKPTHIVSSLAQVCELLQHEYACQGMPTVTGAVPGTATEKQ